MEEKKTRHSIQSLHNEEFFIKKSSENQAMNGMVITK
jgi:hypothetical protein